MSTQAHLPIDYSRHRTNTYHIKKGVSHRPPTASARRASAGSPAPESRSSLATLLQNFNTSELARISATMNGIAKLLPAGSEEEEYYRQQHLENNTFDPTALATCCSRRRRGERAATLGRVGSSKERR